MTVNTSVASSSPSPVDTTTSGKAVTSPKSAGPSTFTESDIFNGAARRSNECTPKLHPELKAAGRRSSGASQPRRPGLSPFPSPSSSLNRTPLARVNTRATTFTGCPHAGVTLTTKTRHVLAGSSDTASSLVQSYKPSPNTAVTLFTGNVAGRHERTATVSSIGSPGTACEAPKPATQCIALASGWSSPPDE